ncbi:hypothetical protein I6J77_11165 [Rhodanobacter sp. FDAARGOS 1247]|uniref:hypothetical protein n=1 Tax=Rhodanobacter sp. FDAARGOS 1247 TaxID=2778082 RepID=UPI00194FAFD5|nr:hypothetical protein [Rhodanobacter sp. FDAARGOS 1247]QRP62697.1 hypothetical protein I6J77_11165 [Rhodanobacter sp. FDAARGOS 1247]
MNELTLAEKEAILRSEPGLCLDDLDGALSVEIVCGPDGHGNIDGFLICQIAGEKPDYVDVRIKRFRYPLSSGKMKAN